MFSTSLAEDYEIITRESLEKDTTSAAITSEISHSSSSSSMSGLKVKAILLKEGEEGENQSKEIRRFRIDHEETQGVSGQFHSLLARVHSVFNVDPATQGCTLYWKDDDEDMVQFSTDGELTCALDSMTDDTFRVYVSIAIAEKEMDVGQRKGHKCHGKHGCHKKKGGKHGAQNAFESEDSAGDHKLWKKVPKELRKYARITIQQMHKDKGNNSDNKEEATRAGVTSEIQEFVEQVLVEWHAKLTNQPPRVVATEMMEGERALPTGMEQDHFLWLCRLLARWHTRHAGKCDVMSGWSSGETTTDDTSGEESGRPFMQGAWPCTRRERHAMKKMMKAGGCQGDARMMAHFPPPPPPSGGPGATGQSSPDAMYAHCPLDMFMAGRRGRGMGMGMRGAMGGGRGGGCRGQQPEGCRCRNRCRKCGQQQEGATSGACKDEAANGVAEDPTKKM